MKTIKQFRLEMISELNNSNIEDSNSIANLIMQNVLNCTKEQLLINDNIVINDIDQEKMLDYVNQIILGKPIEHITFKKSFMNCELYVNENVLIPRQDTEVLVENVIDVLKQYDNNKIDILELCTGSGCISVGLLVYLKESGFLDLYNKISIVAVDISDKALEVAKINVEKYDLLDKIKLIQSDLFNNIDNRKYDIIVSNPPYIKNEVITTLNDNVKSEPIIALDGGIDGLDFYNRISSTSKEYLEDGGYILYEIGFDQSNDVSNILINEGYSDIIVKKDLSGNDRVVISRK